jgi:purine-nucleoside phosphorylase
MFALARDRYVYAGSAVQAVPTLLAFGAVSLGGAPVSSAGAFERVAAAAQVIERRCGAVPELAVILGSGLGDAAANLTDAVTVPYAELPSWPISTVAGHPGRLVVGALGGRRVAALAGRVHTYEGYSPDAVAFATRVMARLGVTQLVLTNAAGGINAGFSRGMVMIIDDHINLLGANPLTGVHDDRFGPRFPDMSHVYSARLRVIADEAAVARGVSVAHGVYAAVAGPSYETPAEICYLRAIGADAVGMSTVPEAIVARQMGLEVLGLSCITNMAAGVHPEPLGHDDVLETMQSMRATCVALLEEVSARL